MHEDDERTVFRPCCQIEGGMSLGLDGVFGDGHIRSPFFCKVVSQRTALACRERWTNEDLAWR